MKTQAVKNINNLKKTKLYKVGCMKQKVFKDRKIPSLSLFGTWLSDAGFKPDDYAQVSIYNGTLVVRQIKNEGME
jgi:hypothetical protein